MEEVTLFLCRRVDSDYVVGPMQRTFPPKIAMRIQAFQYGMETYFANVYISYTYYTSSM